MRLRDLKATFLRRFADRSMSFGPDGEEYQHGIQFLCPKCFVENVGPIGTHSIICWFINPKKGDPVPADETPGPGRWLRDGDTLDVLTLGPGPTGQRSVLLQGGCNWHGYVTLGEVTTC